MEDLSLLTLPELKAKRNTLMFQTYGLGLAGGVGGLLINSRNKGSFGKGLLLFIAGGVALGLVPRLAYFGPKILAIDQIIAEKEGDFVGVI